MNPIIRHLILQKVRAYAKAREEGKVVKFSFLKSLEKFIQGGGITLVATVLALMVSGETGETEAVVKDVSNNLLVAIPVIAGLLTSVVNAIKFFLKQKRG